MPNIRMLMTFWGWQMKKFLASLVLGLSALLGANAVQAASINFVIGDNSSVSVDDSGFFGADVNATVRSALSGLAFSLAPGQSQTFAFFDISLSKCKIVCFGSADFSATLDFLNPSAQATGTGSGGAASLFGKLTAGALLWDNQPLLLTTSAGTFSVLFHDLVGIAFGKTYTVNATVTALSAVPLPAAAWLFGSALLGLAGAQRLRKRQMAVQA